MLKHILKGIGELLALAVFVAAMVILGLVLFTNSAHAATAHATLNWTRPSTYVDGSPLTTISGYRVLCMITPVGVENGTSCTPVPAVLPGNTNTTGTVTVQVPPVGARLCFRLVTVVVSGVQESDPSAEACKDIGPTKPGTAGDLAISIVISIGQASP